MSALHEALAHHQAGRHDVAETLYCRIIDAAPTEPTALFLSGMLNCEIGEIGRAKSRLEAVVSLAPDHLESHLALARVLLLDQAPQAAVTCYRRAVSLDPAHAGAQIGLGEALLALGDPGAAVAPLLAASRLRPGDSRILITLATALLGAGRPAEGLAAADGADPDACDTWLARGACLKALCCLPEAAAALRRAVALAPRRAAALLNLGNVCAELELFEEADRHLGAAVASDPASAEAHTSRGSALLLAGRPAEAESCYRQALALDPAMVVAHQNLAAILTARRQHGAARHHRDLAYRRQNVFVEPAAAPRRSVLLLATAAGGNVPARYLFPRAHTSRITWVVEYAEADQHLALPPYDLVFNAIGDPDMAAGTERPVADFLRHCRRPVLNDPARVARTGRHLLPDLLGGIDGVVVPAVRRLPPGSPVAAAGIAPPVLVRPAGSHGGQDVTLIASTAGATIGGPEDGYVSAFHDFRSPDGMFRKFRVIFVDRASYPYHLAIGRQWLVHYETADMTDPAKLCEEQQFLAAPEAVLGGRAMAALRAIGQALDLDFCGVDFALLPDGRILVFEANATMLVHPEDDAGALAYKNRRVSEILDAFEALVGRRSKT